MQVSSTPSGTTPHRAEHSRMTAQRQGGVRRLGRHSGDAPVRSDGRQDHRADRVRRLLAGVHGQELDQDPEDLKGKTFASRLGSSGELFVQKIRDKYKLGPDDVQADQPRADGHGFGARSRRHRRLLLVLAVRGALAADFRQQGSPLHARRRSRLHQRSHADGAGRSGREKSRKWSRASCARWSRAATTR